MAEPTPEPRAGLAPALKSYADRSPIGEVTVLIYDWQPGKSEVRVRYPETALQGTSVPAQQESFRTLVMGELQRSMRTLSERPG